MPRELTPLVKAAIQKLFSERAQIVDERLRRASAYERAHQDILAFALADEGKLEELCVRCEDDERNVWMLEDMPEEFLTHIMRKDDATAELARRYEFLGFPIPVSFSRWGRWSKSWKKEWPVPADI
jgi:hypothetical protein